MNGFDLKTITTTFIFVSLFRIVVTYMYCLKDGQSYPGLRFFLAEAFTYSVSQILIVLRGVLPDWLSIVAGNELLIIGSTLYVFGINRFAGRRIPLLPDLAIPAANLVAFAWFTFFHPSLRFRSIALNIALFFVAVRIARLIRKDLGPECRRVFRGIELLFILLAVGVLGRLANLALNDIPESFFGMGNTLESLFILLGNLLELALTFGVQSAINRRLSSEISATMEEKESLLRTLETRATVDSLSGAWNRPKLDSLIEAEISRAERYDTPFSVIILDIDHFKAVNDNLGHLEGDRVLMEIARTLKESLRTNDMLGRWGGDEFLILCPNTRLDEARSTAEALRRRIAITTSATISLGVAEWRPGELSKDTVRRADDALYRAKTGGRNRVEAAD